MRRINNPTDKTLERRVADVPYALKPGVSELQDDAAKVLAHHFAYLGVGLVPEPAVAPAVREAGRVLAAHQREVAEEKKAAPPEPEPEPVVEVQPEPVVAPVPPTPAAPRSTRKRGRKGGVN